MYNAFFSSCIEFFEKILFYNDLTVQTNEKAFKIVLYSHRNALLSLCT